MHAVLERVTRSEVAVEGDVIGEFGSGLVVLLGVGANDTEAEVELMANKIANLWIFLNRQSGKGAIPVAEEPLFPLGVYVCPFGDGSLLEPRAFSGSLQVLRPLAEGTLIKSV